MKIRQIKNPNKFGWILVLIVIVLLYSSYYLIYIPQQETLVQERSFRILKEYAQNVHDKQNYYKTHLDNYGRYYVLRDIKHPFKVLIAGKNVRKVIDGLEKPIKIYTLSTEDTTRYLKASYYDPNDFGNINYNMSHEYFTEVKNKSSFLKKVEFKDKVAKVPFSKLMENLKFDKLFDNISILDGAHVVYNTNLNVVNDITNTELLLDTISKMQGGIQLKMEINGVKNHLMVLPITFLDQQFYLAGFISDIDFKKKTRTINSQFLTIIAGLLLLMLIGMPILKIIFINRKERLNVSDAHNATVSLILSLSVLLLIFIGTVKYYIIDKKESSDRIKNLSVKLVDNVEKDFNTLFDLGDSIVSGHSEKDEFAASIRKILNINLIDTLPDRIIKNVAKYNTIHKEILEKNFPINEVILIDSAGVVIKAATSSVFSDLVPLDLSDRMYYKTHSNNNSWDFDAKFAQKIFIESIKSYNSGKQETAISFCLNNDSIFGEKAPYLAITSHIPSLYDQVLPEDVEYLVINKNGKVLFHSDQSKNLHENFFVESNNHPKLKAALTYRTTENATISYNERDWLARIVPMKNTPLYHVTLIDLQQTDNKNTKIYLFTFYFLLFTFFCIWIGMQFIQRIKSKESFMDSKTWSFKWLMFHPYKLIHYKRLTLIQSILVFCQVLGFFLISKPVEMLVYQLIFIGYSGFAALSILGQTKNIKSSIYIQITVILTIIAAFLINTESKIHIPLLILALLTFYLFITIKKNRKLKSKSKKSQLFYLSFMLIWLISLTLIPVLSYYKTIENQEEILSEKSKMLDIADQNLHLNEHYNTYEKGSWYTRNKGDGLDRRTIKDTVFQTKTDSFPILEKADSLYSVLPGPNKENNYLTPLLKKHNKNIEWSVLDASTMFYSSSESSSKIKVTSQKLAELNQGKGVVSSLIKEYKFLKWLILLFIPILLLALLVWFIFKYLADIVLNTLIADWKTPKTPDWKSLIEVDNKNPINRILLVSTKNKTYLKDTELLYPTKVIPASEIADIFFDSSTLEIGNDVKIIWIKDLETELLQIEKYDLILDNLYEIEKIAGDRKIVIETPIDIDFINEYFEDYILEYNPEKNEELQILQSTRKLRLFLKEYFRFTGKIDRRSVQFVFRNLNTQNENEKNLLANAHLMKLQYYYIWNNLSRMEKMILFDLADDGMLNSKNKFLINRLKMKGLIEIKPYPRIFTPSFKYFLKFSINPDEAKHLENRLSRQGQWRNTKYLILLILIPLAALAFISQGTSIEKIVGIFTGVVALFSGAMRLMDSNLFRTNYK